MIKKIFAFLTAFTLVTAITPFAVSAEETTDGEEQTVTETTAEETEPPVTETTAALADKTVRTTVVTTAPTQTTPDKNKELLEELERINGEKSDKPEVEPDTEPNGYLVEKVEKFPDERDFITVSTRDGHVFYIVIEYEGDSQKVYFLNTVDTADLQYLLENGGTVTTKVTGNESQKKPTEVTTANSAETTKEEKGKKQTKKNSNTILYIVGGIGIVVFIFIARKKVSGGKKNVDDDEDNSDDYTEEEPEVYVNEDNQEDEYE